VRDAFRAKGHDAWSCDLEPSDSPWHFQDDVLNILNGGWDLGIFHPPCTYLSNSSSKHLYIDGKKENGVDNERWRQLRLGAQFFERLWNNPHIDKVACENPIMLGYAKALIGCGKQTQTVQPWMFGDPEQKATCLWLRGLPVLKPTYATWDDCRTALKLKADAKPKQAVHLAPPGEDRWKFRSLTYQGIANAMADQWG
jgi:hypothetical protein